LVVYNLMDETFNSCVIVLKLIKIILLFTQENYLRIWNININLQIIIFLDENHENLIFTF